VRAVGALILVLAAGQGFAAELDRAPIEAATVDGQKVRLFPNGRWEFVDVAKAAEAQKIAAEYPENKTRPVDAQGGLLGGLGRSIMPGDKDYNRGSLNPKMR
jgi:hypothetical protein